MVVKLVSNFLDVRDRVAKKYIEGDYNAGDELLAAKSSSLPDHIELECLGNRYFYKGDLQEAVRCYEKAIVLAPDHPVSRYQYLIGTLEEKSDNFVDAFKRYQMAIEADPTFLDPYIELGGLLVKVEDFSGAAQCYRDAVKLDATDKEALHNLRVVLEKLVQDGEDGLREELAEMTTLCISIPSPSEDQKW